MMFSSRTAESFDPKPMVSLQTNVRHARDEWCDTSYCLHDPRPNFEPTRDPRPWVNDTGNRYPTFEWAQGQRDSVFEDAIWSPSPELARPSPNPILVTFRENVDLGPSNERAASWLRWLDAVGSKYPDQIKHARNVLTRLVNVYGD